MQVPNTTRVAHGPSRERIEIRGAAREPRSRRRIGHVHAHLGSEELQGSLTLATCACLVMPERVPGGAWGRVRVCVRTFRMTFRHASTAGAAHLPLRGSLLPKEPMALRQLQPPGARWPLMPPPPPAQPRLCRRVAWGPPHALRPLWGSVGGKARVPPAKKPKKSIPVSDEDSDD